MASIDQYIDAAVPLMKARASEFDDAGRLPMNTWLARDGRPACRRNLLGRAERNLRAAAASAQYVGANALTRERVANDLLDTMNLCALVLSVLPEESE